MFCSRKVRPVDKLVRESKVGEEEIAVYEPKNAPYLAQLIFKQVGEYFDDGILDDIITPSCVVFDVGANIGMFALEVLRRTEGDASIYCFEPLPETYSILKKNIDKVFDPSTPFRPAGSKVRALNFGLSDASRTVTFSYRPHAPECSSMYDPQQLKGKLGELTREEEIEHFTEKAYDPSFPLWEDHPYWYFFAKNVYPRSWMRAGVRRWYDNYNKTVDVKCQLRRLSDIIREHKIQKIDLIKVDVELAELDVLRGIDDEDWPKVRAVTVEVHDVNGRLAAIEALLMKHGLTQYAVRQEDKEDGGNIYHLCACRPTKEEKKTVPFYSARH